MWDNRPGSPTYWHYETGVAGVDQPLMLLVPPGVVHAYKNVGVTSGVVFNAPNRLYAGWNRSEPVDEIRHEDDPDGIYQVV